MKNLFLLIIFFSVTGCNPVSNERPVNSLTLDFVISDSVRYLPVVWLKQGEQQVPTPYRMFNVYTEEYLGPQTITIDSSWVSIKYTIIFKGTKIYLSDTLINMGNDSTWIINPAEIVTTRR